MVYSAYGSRLTVWTMITIFIFTGLFEVLKIFSSWFIVSADWAEDE